MLLSKAFIGQKAELFARKIVALLSRTAPRDLYDIHNMIKQDVFSDPDIRARIQSHPMVEWKMSR